MAQVTAADVKKLREMTGAGMMDCKKALAECDGDFDASVDFLRKKGLSAASKKSGRIAAEGLVSAVSNGQVGVLLEVNSETDFVSKNDKFRGFVDAISNIIIEKNPADLDVLKALPFDAEYNVEQALSQLIATIGENMNIRRFVRVEGDVVASYVHGLGKIGVLVTINGQQSDALDEVSRGIAMHVAAVNPLFVTREDVSADVVEREKAVLSERAQASGKPAEIVEKIVLGQLSKFYAENCLLEQDFVVDSDVKVSKALANAQAGATIQSVSRFQLGEGIEKKEEDFAAEVAAQVKGG
ncbi:MAG: elongation factor Ts [Zetaproteobacteria bacterium CG_4_9_14_3_um_filter_49_83]|nr:MAG: translation elongation factor Ts [Zetaproteobacteria bacterium CG1_02_49_23]PIQ34173.1 MAG: elongation factor Ts [Zetaproteobacteria bacterium CG17_big_fil_post_rev_8_21_14_2_50_50_13]PIV29444.1 MAG: elongation factor Ts [Zetaproteobacteria bacterium CG02_land_8_20_14_3_00_50_9]PIY56948.1 MAG: elongation factor Ts [Zetaproteobacteria bacterium CG_4_10_14_0_8_um_filter_49_80]PJA35345.1 MAG: elongation factor Ts [Zetaproteobacteria bacterium CG_4_9_14_3_um_filter_49_83]